MDVMCFISSTAVIVLSSSKCIVRFLGDILPAILSQQNKINKNAKLNLLKNRINLGGHET